MKTALPIVLIVLATVAATGAFSFAQLEFPLEQVLESPNLAAAGELPSDVVQASTVQPSNFEPKADQPRAVAEEREFDFGYSQESTTDHRHSFIVKNTGTAPLKLLRYEVSCSKCTFATLPSEPIPPGGSAAVQVRWNINISNDVFRQHVDVHTNDREHPLLRFVVTGKVIHPFEFEPKEIVFSNVRIGEQAEASARLMAYFSDQLEVLEHHLSNSRLAPHFDVQLNKLSPEQLPQDVKSAVEFKVTLKPGLPLGAFKLKILLKTNLENGEELELPITGNVGGPISIVGNGWNQERSVLIIGHVNRSEGAKRKLTLIIRGKEFASSSLEPAEVNSEVLKVSYGKTNKISGGQTLVAPIEIEIPPGSPLVNHMGSEQGKYGEILVGFKNADLPPVKLLVQFAVVED